MEIVTLYGMLGADKGTSGLCRQCRSVDKPDLGMSGVFSQFVGIRGSRGQAMVVHVRGLKAVGMRMYRAQPFVEKCTLVEVWMRRWLTQG